MSAQRASITQIPVRYAGGGAKIHKIPDTQTDFDVVVVGGVSATALTKFWQNDHIHEQVALVTPQTKYLNSELYHMVNISAVKILAYETDSVAAQVNASSKIVYTKVKQFKPDENKVVLDNGKEYTYRALVVQNGLEQKSEFIEGLKELEDEHRSGVFVHLADSKFRIDKNHYHGWQHFHGDLIYYQPKRPMKDEGLNFFLFYYEHLLR